MHRLPLGWLLLSSCAASRDVPPPPVELSTQSATPAPPSGQPSAAASAAPSDPQARACDAGEKEACLALVSRCAIGSKGDVAWASSACAERERKACDAGDGDSCEKFAERHTDVTGDAGVPKDEAIALEYKARACDGGAIFACTELAFRYESGTGVPKDPARAVALFLGLCDEESGAFPQPCQALARHLVSGDGIAADPARAARIHAASCGQGVCDVDALTSLCAEAGGKGKTNVGCVSLAVALTTLVAGAPETDQRKAKSLLERACRRREPEGCRVLSGWYEHGREWPDGTSTPKDEARAAALMRSACDAGDKGACAP